MKMSDEVQDLITNIRLQNKHNIGITSELFGLDVLFSRFADEHDKLVEMNKELVEALELIIVSPKRAHMGGVDVQLNAEASVKIAEVFKKAKELAND